MKASIIITTYKRSDSLIRAIESCLAQTFDSANFEIVVVDDNGFDTEYQQKNVLLLSEFINSDRVKYVPLEKNSGACHARNVGVNNAVGEYLFFLDDDDEFLPNKVAQQVGFLDENLDFAAHTNAFLKKRNDVFVPLSDGVPVIGDLKSFLMFGNFYTLMLCIRKTVFQEVGGFRAIPRYQDIYFMYHVLLKGHKVFADNTPLFVVYEHDGERISNKGISSTLEAVNELRNSITPYKDRFTVQEWIDIEQRWRLLLATSYYSGTYLNRLKSTKYWLTCFWVHKETVYLQFFVKSFFPNSFIKRGEIAKSTR